MSQDVVFKKKTFGGFDKTDVMNYVSKLLNEKNDCSAKLEESKSLNDKLTEEVAAYKLQLKLFEDNNEKIASQTAEIEQLNALVAELTEKCDRLTEKAEEDDAETERLDALVKELTEKCDKLNEKSEQDNVEIEQLESKLSKMESFDPEKNRELEQLKLENSNLKAENAKIKAMERQVGAAMLDAHMRSDELVKDAKERADSATMQIYSAIGSTAVKIDDLSSGIGEIARAFTKSAEEVELRIKALTGDMSKAAQALLSESNLMSDQIPESFVQRSEEISDELDPASDDFIFENTDSD